MGDPEVDVEGYVRNNLRTLAGDRFPVIERFAELLADEGVLRGLIGPREVSRLWERHILNSAAVDPFLPAEGTVIDVGSGAGLPGIVIACLRPTQHVVLLEPMERRATWLSEVVAALGLRSAEVVRGRAEEMHGRLSAEVVTARAVAPLDRLVRWTLPLVEQGGAVVALKGSRAADEVAGSRGTVAGLGGAEPEILEAPTLPGLPPTTVVRVVRIGDTTVPTRRPRRPRR